MFSITKTDWQPAPATCERHLFAIGDVHGMAKHYKHMLDIAYEDRSKDPLVVQVGDLIDRGPYSLECLALASEYNDKYGHEVLLGNHEQFMFHSLIHDEAWLHSLWFRNGASAIAKELKVEINPLNPAGTNYLPALRKWCKENPDAVAIMGKLKHYIKLDNYLLIHAGVNPLHSLEDWLAQDFMHIPNNRQEENASAVWVREPFLYHTGTWDKPIVIHGHTIEETPSPVQYKHRIGLDSGAFTNLRMTMVEIDGDKMRYHFVTWF